MMLAKQGGFRVRTQSKDNLINLFMFAILAPNNFHNVGGWNGFDFLAKSLQISVVCIDRAFSDMPYSCG